MLRILLQVVLNNFAAGGEPLALTAALFQGLFPPINVQRTSVAACKVLACELYLEIPRPKSITPFSLHLFLLSLYHFHPKLSTM